MELEQLNLFVRIQGEDVAEKMDVRNLYFV